MTLSQNFFLSLFPSHTQSPALCLYASFFFTQVTLWAPNICMEGHSGYLMIKDSLEENLPRPKKLWREKVFINNVFKAPGE